MAGQPLDVVAHLRELTVRYRQVGYSEDPGLTIEGWSWRKK